jgi:hypothetical protein
MGPPGIPGRVRKRWEGGVVKILEARLAVLDTNVLADLASQNATRQKATAERLKAIHEEGLLTAVTGTIITEMIATFRNQQRFETMIDTVVSRVDVYLPFEAPDLVRIEIAEQDPSSAIGNRTLYSTKDLYKLLEAVNDPEVEAFFRAGGFQHDRLKDLLPKLDPEIRKLKPEEGPLPTFAEHVAASEVEHVKAFLESANAKGHLGKVDMSPEALKSLLARGKSTRMAVLMSLANHYRRAKAWLEKKEQTKAAGALSDTRIVGESAYAQVLLTMDKEFVACGEFLNEVVAEPKIRLWEL